MAELPKEFDVAAGDIAKDVNMIVTIKGMIKFRIRLWVASKFITFGAIIAGVPVEINIDTGEEEE